MKTITSLTTVVALAAAATGCAGASPDVKLGAILSLSGAGGPYGNSIKNGVDLAVEQINGAGGINVHEQGPKQINLMFRDIGSDPQAGVHAARELLEAGVIATIGADLSDVTLAIAPVFQESDTILISPATSTPRLSDAGDMIYRNFPSDELEALNTADHIFNKAGFREVAVIANQNEFGLGQKNAFIERFRLLGGREVGQESYPADADGATLQQHVANIVTGSPQAIYIAGYTEDTAAVASAIRAAGSDAALFGTGAVLADGLVEMAGDAAEGLVYPQASFDPESNANNVREFVSAYQAQYGSAPDVYAAHGYDAVYILAQAVQEAGLDPQEIRFYLNSMNPYEGVTGATDFDDNGDVRKFHRMYRIEAGAAVPAEN